MENRIKIGDVWYVREDSLEREKKMRRMEELEIIMSREVMIETDDVLVEGSVLEDDGKFSMPSVDITQKDEHGDMEIWDNDLFLSGVANRDDDQMAKMKGVDEHTKEVAIAVIDKMAELRWI